MDRKKLNRRRWIAIVIFWILFISSIGFAKKYPWLDLVWTGILALLMVVTLIYSIGATFRHSRTTGEYVFTRGFPRWLWWIVYDDETYDKLTTRR